MVFPVSEQKHFFVWRETFSAGFLKLLSSCPGEFSLEKLNCFEKILPLMLILVLWAETYQTFGKKFFAELLKQHFSCPNGSFEVKIFLSKMKLFYEYSQTLTKNVLAFGKKRSAWFSKQHFTCRGEVFAENERLHKNFFFSQYNFLDYEWKFFGPLEEKFEVSFSKKPFPCPEKRSEEKCFFEDHFFSKDLKFWAKFFSYLRKKFRSFINTAFYISRGAFSDFWKFKIFFRFLSEKVSAFCLELFRHGCQNAIPRVWDNVLRKMNWFEKKSVFIFFFCSLSGKVSDFCCYFSRHGFQKCILHVQKKISRRSLFRITLFAETFEFFSQFFQGFVGKNINSVVRIAL